MKNNYMNKRLPECLKNLKNVRRELVNVFKIESHCIGAQRDIDVERARNIGEDWLELCVNDPVLSYDTKTGIYHETIRSAYLCWLYLENSEWLRK